MFSSTAWTGELTSDAEQIDGSWIRTNQSGIHLRGTQLIERGKSLSGSTSVKICKDHKQTFSFELTQSNFLDEINVKVWRYIPGHSSTLCALNKNGQYTYAIPSGKTSGEWEELVLTYNNYVKTVEDTISIFCLFTGEESDTAWFDNFSCSNSPHDAAPILTYNKEDLVSLYIPDSSFQKLSNKRDEALKIGVLLKEKGDLVSAQIDTTEAKVRLKGDWTDHLEGNNWSLRIEPKNEWKGMSKFSVQSPVAKSMLNEWVFRKLLEAENVLTPYYDFVPYQINEDPVTIMAITNHFTEELLVNQGREPGPILKFNEDLLWELRAKQNPTISEYPVIESAEVLVYSKSKYKKGKAKKRASKARALLYAHQHNLKPLDSIFNVDLLAKYFAICELAGASHSYLWHNTRYYYDAETKRLEPIGFDGNASFNGSSVNIDILKKFEIKYLRQKRFLNLVSSETFKSKFVHYLTTFSEEKYLTKFLNTNKSEIEQHESLIQKEYQGYSFPVSAMLYRGKLIQEKLSEMDLSSFQKKHLPAEFATITSFPKFEPNISGIAYSKKNKGDSTTIQILNYHHEAIQIIGVNSSDTSVTLNTPILLGAFESPKRPTVYKLKTKLKAKSVVILSNDSSYIIDIRKSPLPKPK